MTRSQPKYSIVDGEKAPRLHRTSAIAGRAYCGKVVVPLPASIERANLRECRRCAAIDEARRAGMPAFDEEP